MKLGQFIIIVFLLVVMIGTAIAQGGPGTVRLEPGESVIVECESVLPTEIPAPPTETLVPPTEIPAPTETLIPPTETPVVLPTETPIPPTVTSVPPTNTPQPTDTPQPSGMWYGIVRSPEGQWSQIRDAVGGEVVEMLVKESTSDGQILAGLDHAQQLGYQVLLHIYVSSSSTNKPWTLDAGEWSVSQRGREILEAVEGHPGLWAVYQLHEPFDSSSYHANADAQRSLYALLKSITNVPLYTDIASLAYFEDQGLSDGMCDYCATFPTTFRGSTEEALAETFRRIDADLVVQQRDMPNSALVFLINVYQHQDGSRYRLPSEYELRAVRDYMCQSGALHLYYPWSHGSYVAELKDVPALWPVIAEGCSGQPIPTSTPVAPTDTPVPSATSTNTPEPTDTPEPDGAVIVDHTTDVGSLSQSQLDAARGLATFFNHASIGGNILDGIRDLAAQDPGRYNVSIRYSDGAQTGINEYQAGSNGRPLTKVDGFAAAIQNGHDLAMMKFCTGDIPCVNGDTSIETMWSRYRDMMVAQQTAHPNTTLVWWTTPIIASNHSRANCNAEIEWFNNQVRAYIAEHGGILFDVADIESHDPDGNRIMNQIGDEAAWPGYTSDGAHLNQVGQQRVAGALWVLLAGVSNAN